MEWVAGVQGLEAKVLVTPPARDASMVLVVHVVGRGVNFQDTLGPYSTDQAPFEVNIDLDQRAVAQGLVQVFVHLRVVDPETGALHGSRRTRPAYVAAAGAPAEAWYDEATAWALAAPHLPAVEEGTEIDDIVGVEVSP